MHGASCLRIIFNSMTSHAPVTATAAATNKYYFAYGSNLHLEQMKRRCPGSKLIGSAKLWHYRWQINERGYANVMEAHGHWVEGLVFEINQRDESRLDVNEGVSKNAYQKCYMTVMLRRADSPLYRRPVSWIVNNGGPIQARQMAQQGAGQRRSVNHDPHWEQNVLVYISPQYIVDSPPKEEYINRINLGIADARVLGVAEDYISNCIRPFVPATTPKETTAPKTTGAGTTATTPTKPKVVRKVPSPARKAVKQPVREARRPTGAASGSKRTPDPSPARSAPGLSPARVSRPPQTQSHAARRARSQDPPRVVVNTSGRSGPSHRRARSHAYSQPPPLPPRPLSERVAEYYQETTLRPPNTGRARATSDVGGAPPPLPPRPARRMRSIPVIIVQEIHSSSWRR